MDPSASSDPAGVPTGAPHAEPYAPPLVDCGGGIKRIPARHARAFLGLTQAAFHLDRTLDAELQARHGISLRTFGILLHLAAFAPEGHLRMGQLAARASLVQTPLSPSRLSRLIAELEGRGLLRREAAPSDGRGVQISITEEGRATLREAQETHYRGLADHLFSRLTDDELDQLGRIAGKILPDGDC